MIILSCFIRIFMYRISVRCCDVCGQRFHLSLSVLGGGGGDGGGTAPPAPAAAHPRLESPHHQAPVSSLQSPQCPRSAQLTATLSFIISAHSLHDPALSTASAPSPAAIVELSLESLDTPAIPYILDTRNTGGCGLGWPSDMSATHWILFQRSVQVVRV